MLRHALPFAVISLVLTGNPAAHAQNPAAAAGPVDQARSHELLLLKAAQWDPSVGPAPVPETRRWQAEQLAGTDVFLVQFERRVRPADRVALERAGFEPLHYIPHNAYLVRGEVARRETLRQLAGVRATAPFHPAFRISPDLNPERLAALEADAPLELAVFLLPGGDPIEVTARILELGGVLLDWDAATRSAWNVRLSAGRIEELARVADVEWIQPQAVLSHRNNNVTWIVQSNTSGFTPVWNQGLQGENVIIGHIDGLIHKPSCYFNDPNVTSPGPTHRKLVSYYGTGGSDIHGTHTAGTAAGDREPITGTTNNNGIADHARLAHMGDHLIDSTNLRTSLETLFGDGARVFTNSWGNDLTTDYDSWPRDIDRFVWQNQEAFPVWAITNGFDLRNPENAKNCLAVGATQGSGSQHRHCSGGKGPTDDGRRKPELYAPGCGTRSADAVTCGTLSFSGTSMASPAIAATGALALQYYAEGFYPSGVATPADAFTPSGALLKATLLNAGVDMTGVAGYPSNLEGWGRINLDRSLYFGGDTRELIVVDVPFPAGLAAAGEMQSVEFDVTGSTLDLEITLCFPDKNAALSASFAPINDLDLELLAPGGVVYKGNVFASGSSTTGGVFDPLNNVERIKLSVPPLGTYTLNVHAANIATAKQQSYAVVITGEVDPRTIGRFTGYGAGLAGAGGIVPTLDGTGVPDLGAGISLEVAQGVGGAPAQLLIGSQSISLPFAGGELLVAPPWVLVGIGLGGTLGSPGAGSASLPGTLSSNPALAGASVFFQVLILDAQGPAGFSMTAGLEMLIGD